MAESTGESPILVAHQGGVATITLNRPQRLNSFTAAMHARLREVLAALHADASLRCVVLTGAGRAFCAGQDLDDVPAGEGPGQGAIDLGETIERDYIPLVLGLRALPVPVLAAVNGVAAGAGASVALACDLVYAARSASFIQAFAKIGLLPDAGGTWLLPRLAGSQRAMGMAMFGDRLGAEQAEAWGMVWKCVDDDALAATVAADAARLATGAAEALAATKRAIHAAAGQDLAASLALERSLQQALGRSDDFREGVAAFRAKRPPKFRGT